MLVTLTDTPVEFR